MKSTIRLDSKEVRVIIAKFLGIKVEDVIPERYSFSVTGLSVEEIERKIEG